ncbi:DUF6119 family protein [Pyxidicoccus trucidator]|uniref:DUF6119 family protein n=1 Tax=Pyxidicoccus trucidator TaxID=2709662 RepID=UPI0013D911F4|nr:DUF6119 family protein [Pyxidicoccus trucidator]
MKLSIHLANDTVSSFEELIDPKYLRAGNLQKFPGPKKLGYACEGYLLTTRGKPPKWMAFLGSHFDLTESGATNAFASFILLLKVKQRFFAVTFGYGFTALNRGKLEPRFGLLASLNALDPNAVRKMESRNIDLVTRQKSTYVNVESPPHEFDLNFNLDWVYQVAGKPSSTDLGTRISGADSLSINCECTLEKLGDKCAQLLERYLAADYKKAFHFIDHVQPLSRKDPRVAQLHAKLREKVLRRETTRMAIAYPRPPEEDIEGYHISFGRTAEPVDDVTLESVYRFMDAHGVKNADKLRIYSYDPNHTVRESWTLFELLVCELDDGQDTFIHLARSWFRADRDHVAKVREDLSRLTDMTLLLNLPPVGAEAEGTYNQAVATQRSWLNLDKKNFQIKHSRDKVEICDLVTPQKHLICVKKMKDSATLSHLFAQASVSATLLRQNPEYRQHFERLLKQKWPKLVLDQGPRPTFVYAILTDKPGPLHQSLFFFSALNLLDHARRVQTAGFEVAVCRVEQLAVA